MYYISKEWPNIAEKNSVLNQIRTFTDAVRYTEVYLVFHLRFKYLISLQNSIELYQMLKNITKTAK